MSDRAHNWDRIFKVECFKTAEMLKIVNDRFASFLRIERQLNCIRTRMLGSSLLPLLSLIMIWHLWRKPFSKC